MPKKITEAERSAKKATKSDDHDPRERKKKTISKQQKVELKKPKTIKKKEKAKVIFELNENNM
jgi:hypothetical protein